MEAKSTTDGADKDVGDPNTQGNGLRGPEAGRAVISRVKEVVRPRSWWRCRGSGKDAQPQARHSPCA